MAQFINFCIRFAKFILSWKYNRNPTLSKQRVA